MSKIHSTALVDERASVGEDVEIGPYTIIGPDVKIGNNCKIGPYVQLKNKITMGNNNQIFHGCCIGENGQDLTFNNPNPEIEIGDDNIIRENVVIHQPSKPGNKTRIGNKNYIMCNVHLGHDVAMGNNNIIAASSVFGGHVQLQDNVFVSGLVGIHQFVKIGRNAIISAGTPALMDVPPYCMMAGSPGVITGLNIIGMRRAKFSSEKIQVIKNIYKIVFLKSKTPGKSFIDLESDLLPKYSQGSEEYDIIIHYIEFLKNCNRGIAPRQR